jgi:predicted outer membrane repeat protein
MGKEMKKIILSILILISLTFSDIIHVPDDQQTIQMGIVFAANGDTVLVAPGTYTGTGNKNIDFYGKSITLLSENGWENTTIDLEDNGRAFYFHLNEDSTSVVSGFRIYNGYVPDEGGGIYIEYSSPKIINCKIESCYAGDDAGKGGGFFINTNGGLIIENTIIENCGHNTQTDKGGGGYVFEGSLIVRNSIFRNNYMDQYGGGLYLHYTSTPTQIIESSFQNNGYPDQSSGGNGIYTEYAQLVLDNTSFLNNNGYGSGGAIYLDSGGTGNSYISNCQFISNGFDDLGGNGGAIFYSGGSDSLFITSSLFKDNIVSYNIGNGGAIYSYGYISLVNCEVTNNTAFRYPGIYTNNIEVNFSTITNNTSNNGSLGGGADIYLSNSNFQSILTNSIIDSYSNYGDSAPPPIVENIFNDGATAAKFIDQDHGGYRINIHSPCIGMGSVTEIQFDLAGNPRTNPPGSSPDVGCYEHALANTISDPVGIYISPNGNDTLSTGMINDPFGSLSFAVNNLIDYDTIYVNPGSYNDNNLIHYNEEHISTIGLGDVDEVILNLQTEGIINSEGFNDFRNLTVQTQNDSLMYVGSECSFENLILESDIYSFGSATSISLENVILDGALCRSSKRRE